MASAYRRASDAAALAHNFRVFAESECAHEPLYAVLSLAAADDEAVIDLLLHAPYAQRRPVLLFAAIHDLLLSGAQHALARFYRDLNDEPRSVTTAAAVFTDFCAVHREALSRLFAERTVQTNEVGRSAGLALALARMRTRRPIALIDVGCSAGLNLLVDRFRIELTTDDGAAHRMGDGDRVVVRCALNGPDVPASVSLPTIARRVGIDRSPIDVRDVRDARWLAACVWPSETDRHRRLAAAIALAREVELDLRRGDAVECLPAVLADLPDDVMPVVFHSWVVSYFDQETKRRFVDQVRTMVGERDGAWISAEGPNVVPGLVAPALPDDVPAAIREATLWHLTTRDGTALVARSHPHGRWIEWLAA